MSLEIHVLEGQQKYEDMLERQLNTHQKVLNKTSPPTFFLLEHEPVITLGRRTDPEHLLVSKETLVEQKIDLHKINRGGSATYHGPGQLVGYIIARVSKYGGTHELVTRVLNLVAASIEAFGVKCRIDQDNPGVWTIDDHPRKIAAVGMQIKEGVSLHGFAINVDLSLIPYTYIVPCGLNLPITTLSIESNTDIQISAVISWIKENYHLYLIPTRQPDED